MNTDKVYKALREACKNAMDTESENWVDTSFKAAEMLEAVDEAYSFNEYIREHGNSDDALEYMEYLDELAECGGDWAKPTYILARAFYGCRYNPFYRDDGSMRREEFNPNDEYFAFNVYGNLVSVSERDKYRYFASVIDEADYIAKAEEEGRLDAIAEALGIEDEDEDEEDGE